MRAEPRIFVRDGSKVKVEYVLIRPMKDSTILRNQPSFYEGLNGKTYEKHEIVLDDVEAIENGWRIVYRPAKDSAVKFGFGVCSIQKERGVWSPILIEREVFNELAQEGLV